MMLCRFLRRALGPVGLLALASVACDENRRPESGAAARVAPTVDGADGSAPLQPRPKDNRDGWAGPKPRPPRTRIAVTLQPLRAMGPSGSDAPVENPVDLRFSHLGLLISDYGTLDVRVYNSTTGELVRRIGRYGRGPWEFVMPPSIIGTYADPLLLEASVGRLHELSRLPNNGTTTMNRARQWITGCRMPSGHLLTQASASPVGMEYYVSEIGGSARLVDSSHHPIARIQSLGFFVRQTAVRQVDDSTCGYFPAYHEDWALAEADGSLRVAAAVESLPPASMITEPTARGARFMVNAEARSGHVDSRAWRDFVILLFQGTTRERNRILDFYDRRTLAYVGTVVLPHHATRIAVHKDTLAVVEEIDEEPRVRLYLLVSELGQRPLSYDR